MDGLTLPPELERFAAEMVAAGRYRDKTEVVEAALSGLKRLEEQRAALLRSVMDAEAEGERHGFLTVDEVVRDADALIEDMAGTVR